METYLNRYATASLAAIIAILLLVGAVMATQTTDTAATTATVTVDEWLSVTLTNVPVTFSNMDPGTGPTPANVSNGYPATATIGSESNIDANVSTKADAADFVSGSDTFAVSFMEWDFEDSFPGTNYTTSYAQVCGDVAPSSACNIYHQLTVPTAQAAGSYSVAITITATKA